MDDQTIATLCHDFGKVLTVSGENYEPPLIHKAETVEVNTDLGDESIVSIDTPEISYQEQTLPIFQKIEDLSTKVHDLKKEHAALSDEVKCITGDSFPCPEVFCALKDLSVQHELLRRKYDEECALLKKRYLDECSERKRLYNEVIELKGNIRVFCRCRPLNSEEVANLWFNICG